MRHFSGVTLDGRERSFPPSRPGSARSFMALRKLVRHTMAALIGTGLTLLWCLPVSAQTSGPTEKAAPGSGNAPVSANTPVGAKAPISANAPVGAKAIVGCVTTRQINQPLRVILEDLARQCDLSSTLPRPLGSTRMTLEANRLTLEEALTSLFDSSAIDYALRCGTAGSHCSLRVFDFSRSGSNQGTQVIRATPLAGVSAPRPQPARVARSADQIDLTNLQEEDIQRLRASLGPQELQLLRLFGFDPNNMSNQQILQLVKSLTQNQFQTIEQMGLDPKALRVRDLRRLLFSVPTPQ